MKSQSLGIATRAAVVLHDVPQEVREESDYPGTEFRRQTVAGARGIFVVE